MRRPRRQRRKLMAEINVVPYIDVMLVLLIIFMVTAPLMSQGVKVSLPQAASKTLPPEKQTPIVVTVNAEGVYFLNINAEPKASVTPNQLQNEVTQALQQNPARKVYVRGDRHVPYGQVVQAMVLLQQSGASGVGLITEAANVAKNQ